MGIELKTAAVILSAGFGSRMGPLTENRVKPMLPVAGRPILEYTISQLVAAGVSDIGINLHYFADQITNHFGDGKPWQANLNYVFEPSPTGTAGGVKRLEGFLKTYDNVIVIYGDILTDFNYQELILFHQGHGRMGTVCLHQRSRSNSIVEFNEENVIHRFSERPSEAELKKQTGKIWVNSAIYCFRKEILEMIPFTSEITDFPKDIFPKLVQDKQLMAYPINCHRIAIDDAAKYQEAEDTVSSFRFS